jgi:3D (Asp-Asp-Asp) domain-containing protein
MVRNIISTLILAVLAFLVHQQLSTMEELHQVIVDQDVRLSAMERAQAADLAHAALLGQITMNNHKLIQDMQPRRELTVTAYSPRESETDSSPFLTATNRRVRAGIVAVSRDLFDQGWVFGKKVYVKGYGIYTIDDLMHKRKRNQIDIFMYDTQQALRFGRKELEVYLLDLEPLSQTADASDVLNR